MKNAIDMAINVTNNCYVPYSNFYVGCTLITEDNKAFTGCNIENATYGATNCAERTAFYKAISEGYKRFKCIVIVGGKNRDFNDFCTPCGICRQVMKEFCNKDFKIILANNKYETKEFTLEQLLPEGFELNENL